MADAYRDQNSVPTLIAASNVDGKTPIRVFADPVTHRLLVDSASGGGTGTYYDVSGTIDGSNATFTIATTALSDFLLFLARQPQAFTTDFTYVAGVGTTTITYVVPPDASLSGQPHQAFLIS